jgi:monofunctional biosynthetic peptidoglycan transglycosylase
LKYLQKKELAQKYRHKRYFVLFFLIILVFSSIYYLFFIPDVSILIKENPGKTSFMKYREKECRLKNKKYKIQQQWVPFSEISPYIKKAVLISEDDKFWSHEGFDYEAIRKAIEKDVKAKKFKLGGSTISQQLAKNLYLSPEKNIIRKIREAIITWKLERTLSKKRILEIYLNVVEWGEEGIFGVEAASRYYFGKPAALINPEEASRLASVLPNPRKYNPLSNSKYVKNRSELIYSIMVRRGIVVPEYEEVIEENKSDAGENESPGIKTSSETEVPLTK